MKFVPCLLLCIKYTFLFLTPEIEDVVRRHPGIKGEKGERGQRVRLKVPFKKQELAYCHRNKLYNWDIGSSWHDRPGPAGASGLRRRRWLGVV